MNGGGEKPREVAYPSVPRGREKPKEGEGKARPDQSGLAVGGQGGGKGLAAEAEEGGDA